MRHVKRALECCAVIVLSAVAAAPLSDRSYAGGKVVVEIGNETQPVTGVAGGSAVGVVVAERAGADGSIHKHLGNVKFEDIVIQAVPPAFSNAIRDALDGKVNRLNGVVHYADMDMREQRRQTFQN